MNEVELYQNYIDAKMCIQHYIDCTIYTHRGFNEDMDLLESVCNSVLRKIKFIREYEQTHKTI